MPEKKDIEKNINTDLHDGAPAYKAVLKHSLYFTDLALSDLCFLFRRNHQSSDSIGTVCATRLNHP